MIEETMSKPHVLTVTMEPGHEDCILSWYTGGDDHCGGGGWLGCLEYALQCPYGPGETQPDCQLVFECDHHGPDDEDFPCLDETVADCGTYRIDGDAVGLDRWKSDHWCANAQAYAIAVDEWEDSHPYGAWEPSPGCWAQYALGEDPDAASGFMPGVYDVNVHNEGALDDSYLSLERIAA